MFLRFFILVIILPSHLLSAAIAQEHWQKPAFILNAFSEVALKNEYGPDDGRIKKWHSPVNIWIDHQVGDRKLHEELLLSHVKQLAEITRHPIRIVNSPEKANVRFVFTRFENMQETARKELGKNADSILYSTLCLAQINTAPSNEISSARILIPVDQARMHGKLISCIVEEMTQVLGLVNDSNAVYPSIFNDRTPNELLSGLDYLLLKILYDPQLHAGMHKSQVLNIAKEVIAQLVASGEVSHASKRVSTGYLYELLGYR